MVGSGPAHANALSRNQLREREGRAGRGSVLIEYGVDPNGLVGSQVEVDGRLVGVLKPFGSANRTGFALRKGSHTVRVLRAGYESQSREVNVEPGIPVMLIVDYGDSMGAAGVSRPVITFQ